MKELFDCVIAHPWVALYIAILGNITLGGLTHGIISIKKSYCEH